MILVFSNYVEESTAQVIQWLNFKNSDWFRINNLLEKGYTISISEENIFLNIIDETSQKSIKLNDVKAVWYRRKEHPKGINLLGRVDLSTLQKINKNVFSEEKELFNTLANLLSESPWLNHPFYSSINKPLQLKTALQIGLKVPDTLITTSKEELMKFQKKHQNILIKNLSDLRPFSYRNKYYNSYSKILSEKIINNLPNHFFPTLVQGYVEKEIEIRTFYLDGNFYSMAMFTQTDPQTRIDFRRYNDKNPTRIVPYKLPDNIEVQLHQLMQSLHLNSGSLDIILTKNNEYIFLEANPVGQFGMVSYPCNYYLEEKIADWLISKN